MWARVHKIDRIRPQPDGSAIVLIEDERTRQQMERLQGLSITIAIARIIGARRALDAKFGGKGEIRYASAASLPSFLFEAIARAGAAVSDAKGERVLAPPQPASVDAVVDAAFAELAHTARTNLGAQDISTALRRLVVDRKKQPLDREREPARYWPAVFEVAALVGELWRPRGGRWVESADSPVPFAVKMPGLAERATPARVAERVVLGEDVDESLPTPVPLP